MTYDKLSELLNTAKSLQDLRNIFKNLDDVKGQKRADLGEMFLMQWRALGGSFEELKGGLG